MSFGGSPTCTRIPPSVVCAGYDVATAVVGARLLPKAVRIAPGPVAGLRVADDKPGASNPSPGLSFNRTANWPGGTIQST